MSWAQNKSALARAAFSLAVLTGVVGASAASAEDAIIVKSTMREYPVGSKIDDETTITLATGDRISVLTRRGSRSMKGPGTFVVGANPKSNRNRFTNLKRRGASSRSDAGATRNARVAKAGRPSRPKVFYVDLEMSGRVCLTDTSNVALWRPKADKPASYVVNGVDLAAPVAVSFAADQTLAPPEGAPLALSGGATYTISGGSSGPGPAMTVASVTVIDLGRDYQRADQLAQAFFDNGCMAQFEIMSERLVADG